MAVLIGEQSYLFRGRQHHIAANYKSSTVPCNKPPSTILANWVLDHPSSYHKEHPKHEEKYQWIRFGRTFTGKAWLFTPQNRGVFGAPGHRHRSPQCLLWGHRIGAPAVNRIHQLGLFHWQLDCKDHLYCPINADVCIYCIVYSIIIYIYKYVYIHIFLLIYGRLYEQPAPQKLTLTFLNQLRTGMRNARLNYKSSYSSSTQKRSFTEKKNISLFTISVT